MESNGGGSRQDGVGSRSPGAARGPYGFDEALLDKNNAYVVKDAPVASDDAWAPPRARERRWTSRRQARVASTHVIFVCRRTNAKVPERRERQLRRPGRELQHRHHKGRAQQYSQIYRPTVWKPAGRSRLPATRSRRCRPTRRRRPPWPRTVQPGSACTVLPKDAQRSPAAADRCRCGRGRLVVLGPCLAAWRHAAAADWQQRALCAVPQTFAPNLRAWAMASK